MDSRPLNVVLAFDTITELHEDGSATVVTTGADGRGTVYVSREVQEFLERLLDRISAR